MKRFSCPLILFSGCLLSASGLLQAAPIQVDGVQDRQNLTGPASIQVVTEPTYIYQVQLDNQPIPADEWLTVTRAGYHQIDVSRTPMVGGTSEFLSVRFNLYDPVRGSAEWGLFPWTPAPGIHSAAHEFFGSDLVPIAPSHFPAQRAIPWIGLIEDGAGHGKRLNGQVEFSGISADPIPLKRGVSQAMLAGQAPGLSPTIRASVRGLETQRVCSIDSTTDWQLYSGDLPGDTTWPTNGRIRVSGDLRIPAGTTLTVEAGCIVVLDPEVNIVTDGSLDVQGTRVNPSVFMPTTDGMPWGGFMLYQPTSRATVTGGIFVGSGAIPNWMSSNGYDAHRKEQALFLLDAQSQASFRDVYVIESAGQAFHGQNATLSLDHVLIRECTTVGQFNDSTITIRDCALIDFPFDDDTFVDADNDALYFNRGTLEISHTLLGWTKDDGIDAGGGGGGTVLVSNCWFEACFHEGMALSGSGKQITVLDSVFTQCGQGIETGYDSPQAFADHCLLIDNEIGLRFGDNYDWSYGGFLRATNCISINNHRDVWNMCRDIWSPRPSRVDIQGNWQSNPDPAYPGNSIWNTAADASRLDPFIAAASAPGPVGVGFPTPSAAAVEEATTVGIAVSLSMVSSQTVLVDYVVGGTATPDQDFLLPPGTLAFPPGSVRQTLCLELLADDENEPTETIEIRLSASDHGDVSPTQSTHTFSITGGRHYVSPTGAHLAPFDSWANAATNLQAAVDVAADGATVLVSHGRFVLNAPLAISRGVTLLGQPGPGQVVIDGAQAHRCITVTHADALIDGFTITGGAASSGAGVYLDGGGTVQNCLIVSNAVTGSGADGGGITCYRGGTVQRCMIRGNTATDDAGGVYCNEGGRVSDCVVTENDCGDKGGGIYARNGGEVDQCTVTFNNASFGGGLYNVGGSARNSIFYFNSGGTGVNVYNSGNQTFYTGCCSEPAQAGTNNRGDSPDFVDGPVNDLRLNPGSPCIDAGTVPAPSAMDHTGVPRPLDGNLDGDPTPDIGAHEYLHASADSDLDGLPDGWEWNLGLDPSNGEGSQGPAGDPDGDTMSNLQEYQADTRPDDAQSLLVIREVIPAVGSLHLVYSGGVEAVQILESSVHPADPSEWTPVFTNHPPTSIMVTNPVSGPEPVQLYRIRAHRPGNSP